MQDYISFIGLGQCGMRITTEFGAKGYSCAFLHSDENDARGYSVNEDKVLILKGTGTGKSLKVGQNIVEDYKSKFESFIKKNCNKHGLTILVAGAGGGTGGSFIGPAAKYIKSLGYKCGVLLTIPNKMFGIVPQENSLRTVKELKTIKDDNGKTIDLDFFLIADNDMLLDDLGSNKTYWGKVNKTIVESVNSMFEILEPRKISKEGLGSIDKAELIRCLTYGKGHIDVNCFYLTVPQFSIEDKELEAKLFTSVLVDGYNYKEGLCYTVCVDVPHDFSKEHIEIANRIFTLSKNKIGRGIAIPGMFTDLMLGQAVRVTLIVSGLGMPKILESRIKNLKRDLESFKEKHNKEDKIRETMDSITDSGIDEDFSL